MNRIGLLALGLVICFQPAMSGGAPAASPKIDKTKFEAYVRFAEGFAPEVKAVVEDPTPSSFKGFYRVVVHYSAGQQKLDRYYYVTPDGQQFINGSMWNLNDSPFRDTLDHLPSEGPSFGPANAKVQVVIFSDFECPYCRELAKTIRDNIPAKYPSDVRVMFKDFPIDVIHKWAREAAEASHCVAAQRAADFWAFHDWIFEHQQEIDPTNLKTKVLEFAKQHNQDVLQLSSCIDSHATAAEVEKSQKTAQALQITQTPTLFVNGRMIPSAVKWEQLEAIIKLELNRPKEVPGVTAEKCCEVTMPMVGKN